MKKYLKNLVFVFSSLVLISCSSMPSEQYQDPLEGFNRKVHGFNQGVDQAVIVPVSKGYRAVTPDPVERGVSNFFDNLFYPTVVVNQFLQGKFDEGFSGIGRVGLNTTLGIVGFFDVATDMGLPEKQEDFGQTFAKWGFGSGPYIVLPIRGGVTLRDGLGSVAAIPTQPTFWLKDQKTAWGLRVLSAVDTSASLLEAREMVAGDSYLFFRDAYVQRREFLINDGAAVEDDPFLDE